MDERSKRAVEEAEALIGDIDRQRRYLEHRAEGHSIRASLKWANATRNDLYKKWRISPAFNEAEKDAFEAGSDVFEDTLFKRAVEGVEEPVFYKGEVVGYVKKYDTLLLMFALKARRPLIYRDNVKPQEPEDAEKLSIRNLRKAAAEEGE